MGDYSLIGKRIPRIDSPEKATGSAKYTADIRLPGMLYGKILRSPYPHARILNIDTSRAEKLPGVNAVVTGQEIAPVKFGIFKQTRDQYLLAKDRVRYVGEEIAAVAAIEEDIAEEALDLIRVDYEPLPAVFNPIRAMEESAPQLHDHVKNNIGFRAFVHGGDIESALKEAYRIYEYSVEGSKISHMQMEPYAALASFDPSGKLDIWVPNQSPFTKRRALSNALRIPLSKIRIRHCHIGGGFGGRSDTFPPEFCASLLSIKCGRPVMIVCTREETMFSARQKHSTIVELKIAVKRDGTLLGKDARVVLDGGAYLSSGVTAANAQYDHSEAVYRVDNYRYEAFRVYTNKTPCSMQRTQHCQMVLAEEILMDMIAEDLGLDPVELRMKHAVKAGEILPSGSKVTSYALDESIRKATAAAGWNEKRGKLGSGRGIGMACDSCGSAFNLGFRSNSAAYIKFNEDGSATLFSGNVDNGQGNESMLVQIAAEVLGLSMGDITLVNGDTELCPQDPGTYPMASAFVSGNAVRLAALDANRQMREIAAESMGLSPENLQIGEQQVYMKEDPKRAMPVADVVKLALLKGDAVIGRGSFTPKPASEFGWADHIKKSKGQHRATYTCGTTIAEVEVDLETGRVRVVNIVQAYDCGFALNPMVVEGQWEGVAVQMLGETLYEKHIWDEKSGQLVTDSLSDYKIPGALDIPKIQPLIVESAETVGPFGAKEVGISAGGSVEAAIANAIYNAVGVRVKETPIMPESILQALSEKKG